MNATTQVGTIKQQTVGDMFTGQARVRMFNIRDGRVVVATYWPAGIDLIPSVYGRFADQAQAESAYRIALNQAVKMLGPRT